MLTILSNWDTQLLLFINGHHTSFMDDVMWFVSLIWPWIPLYIILIFYIIKKYKTERWYMLVAILLLITLSDQLSASVIKNLVCRLRPSHNPQLDGILHLVNDYRGGVYGFVSSHAANTFALATFASLLFKNRIFTIVAISWACLISYSRMYLGVHYPGDIVCGALLGIGLAIGVFFILSRLLKKKPFHLSINI